MNITFKQAATGVVTLRGGLASHAAAWMRSVGKPAVTMLQNSQLDSKDGWSLQSAKGDVLREGAVVTIDGSTGTLFKGDIPVEDVVLDEDFFTILNWARKYKKMNVFATASTTQDIQHALENGADGIGLFKTEQLFFDRHRVDLVRQIVLTDSESERAGALAKLQEMQRENLYEIFKAVGDREFIVRLLDLSLNQVIPDPSDATALEDMFALSQRMKIPIEDLRRKLSCLYEKNPFLGVRGCRLGILFPYFVTMQIRAIIGMYVFFHPCWIK
jgi:pyruvate,orthophosphate dikinase